MQSSGIGQPGVMDTQNHAFTGRQGSRCISRTPYENFEFQHVHSGTLRLQSADLYDKTKLMYLRSSNKSGSAGRNYADFQLVRVKVAKQLPFCQRFLFFVRLYHDPSRSGVLGGYSLQIPPVLLEWLSA